MAENTNEETLDIHQELLHSWSNLHTSIGWLITQFNDLQQKNHQQKSTIISLKKELEKYKAKCMKLETLKKENKELKNAKRSVYDKTEYNNNYY